MKHKFGAYLKEYPFFEVIYIEYNLNTYYIIGLACKSSTTLRYIIWIF